MGRSRTIPDTRIHAALRKVVAIGGEKAATFASVAAETGLAPPTLVQRFGSRDAMVRAAQIAAWDALDAATEAALASTADKGPQALLKTLGPETFDLTWLALQIRDDTLRQRATLWRATVVAALSLRLGGGAKGREAASLLFAAWQGQLLWSEAGGKGFRIKNAVKGLT